MSGAVWPRPPLAGFARVYVRPLEQVRLSAEGAMCDLPHCWNLRPTRIPVWPDVNGALDAWFGRADER